MFDIEQLARRCLMPENEFDSLGDTADYVGRRLIYIDRGADILGVAHLDSVSQTHRFIAGFREGGAPATVWSPRLDNRFGAYILLDLLPEIGITTDVLLATDEELLESTATWFDPGKDYKWMFGFDREGTDAVLYHYEIPGLVAALASCGIPVGAGKYSDIAEMWHVGCRGINFGNGVYAPHTEHASVYLPIATMMVAKFAEFYRQNRHTSWPYEMEEGDLDWLYGSKYEHLPGIELEHTSDDFEQEEVAWCDYCGSSVEPAELIWLESHSAEVCSGCANLFWPHISW